MGDAAATAEEMIDTPEAQADQDALNAKMRELVEAAGGTYNDAPTKKMDRAISKVESKYDGDHRLLGDTVRAGFVAESAAQVTQVLDGLAAEYTMFDEGFATSDLSRPCGSQNRGRFRPSSACRPG